MSAPINIPIGIKDEGTAALDKLATGFDNLWQKGDKLTQQFGHMERAGGALQTKFEAVSKVTQVLAGHFDGLTKSAGLATDAFKLLGDSASMTTRNFGLMTDSIDASISAQRRAVGTVSDLTIMYRTLAAEQRMALENQRTLNTELRNVPKTSPLSSTGGGGGGGSDGRGGILGSATSMAGYMLAYGAYSGITQSLGRDTAYSRQLGTTAGMTNMTPDQIAQLSALTRQQAGSGKQPFDATTLLQGEYSLASLGIGGNDPKKIADAEMAIAKLSAAGGATDTSVAGNAITSLLASYQLNNDKVVQNTQRLADQLQVGVKLGKVDLPTFATQASGPLANTAAQLGVSTADVIAGIAAESVGGVSPGSQGQDFYAMLASSSRPTMPQKTEAAALGIQYDSRFWGQHGVAGGMDIINQAMARQGISGAMEIPVLGKLFGQQDAATAFLGMRTGGIASFAPQVADSKNASDAAFRTSQSYAGNQLADAEAKLATAFDNLTTAALPSLTRAVNAAATALGILGAKHPGDALNKALGTQNLPEWMQQVGGFTDAQMRNAGLMDPTGSGQTPAQRAAAATALAQANYALAHPLGVVGSPSSTYQPMPTAGSIESYGRAGQRIFGGLINRDGGQGQYNALAFPTYGGMVTRDDATAYAGETGLNSPAYRTSMITGRGGSASMPEVANALTSLKNTISAGMSKTAVESMLGTYRQIVLGEPDALLSPAKKSADIFSAEKMVTNYERGLRGVGDQNAVNSAQASLDMARALNDTPAQLKVIFNQYLDAERKLAEDTMTGKALAKQLGVINQQGAVFTAQQATDALKLKLQDLADLGQAATLGGNRALANQYAKQAYGLDVANAGALHYDAAHLTLLKAQLDNQMKIPTPGSTLIRSPESGLGDALTGAGSGVQTIAGLARSGGAQDPLAETVRHLQQQIRLLERELAEQQKTNDHLVDIKNELVSGAVVTSHPAANRGPVRRQLGI